MKQKSGLFYDQKYVKNKAKYIRRIIFADKRKVAVYLTTVLVLVSATIACYLIADQFMKTSAKRIGELSVLNASEKIERIFETGENIINTSTDSVRNSERFYSSQMYIQPYLQLLYTEMHQDSDNFIENIYCYYNGQLYVAGQDESSFDLSKNQAYMDSRSSFGEIYYIPPHLNDGKTATVITIAKKFGTKNADMMAVDIRVDQLRKYLNEGEENKEGTGDITNSSFYVLVDSDEGIQKNTVKDNEDIDVSNGSGQLLASGVRMYQLEEKNVSYNVFTKKVGKDWYVSYKIASSQLYYSQYLLFYQIILMAFIWIVLCLVLGIIIYRRELIQIVDPLTGLLNKNGVIRVLSYYLNENVKKRKKNIAVVYFDLDNFKQVNDKYGHDTGDKIIKKSADLLHHVKHAFFGRIGGDEYAGVIYADISQEEIIQRLEQFLKEIGQKMEANGNEIYISCSIGVVFHAIDGETDAYTLLNRADENMYIAKKTGKNKIFWS